MGFPNGIIIPEGIPLPPAPKRLVKVDDIQPMSIESFWYAHSEWSQATFGPDGERGPVGALKHLALEVLHELLGIDKSAARSFVEVGSNPSPDGLKDLYEYVDTIFLAFDAARRAGFTLDELITGLWTKLAINKARKWNVAPPGQPSEHVR